ncbi:hypothetical protein FEW53_002368 [Enterococcus faecalis]|nr:hypothetical protein [Enterococcus faecalis]
MKPLKIVPVAKYPDVYQVTIRSVSEYVCLLYEENIIEFYSREASRLVELIEELFRYNLNEQHNIIEVGSEPIFSASQFFNVTELLMESEYPYYQLNKISASEAQVIIVQTKEIWDKNGISLISALALNARELKILLFLTEGKEPRILPILNFAQVITQPLVDIIGNSDNNHYSIVEQINRFLLFNLMI